MKAQRAPRPLSFSSSSQPSFSPFASCLFLVFSRSFSVRCLARPLVVTVLSVLFYGLSVGSTSASHAFSTPSFSPSSSSSSLSASALLDGHATTRRVSPVSSLFLPENDDAKDDRRSQESKGLHDKDANLWTDEGPLHDHGAWRAKRDPRAPFPFISAPTSGAFSPTERNPPFSFSSAARQVRRDADKRDEDRKFESRERPLLDHENERISFFGEEENQHQEAHGLTSAASDMRDPPELKEEEKNHPGVEKAEKIFSSFHEETNEEVRTDAEKEGSRTKAEAEKQVPKSSPSSSSRSAFRQFLDWLSRPGPLTRALQAIGQSYDRFVSLLAPLRNRQEGTVPLPEIRETEPDPGREILRKILRKRFAKLSPRSPLPPFPLARSASSSSLSSSSSSSSAFDSSYGSASTGVLLAAKKLFGLTRRSAWRSFTLRETRRNLFLRLKNRGLLSVGEGRLDYAVEHRLPRFALSSPSSSGTKKKKTPRLVRLVATVLFNTSRSRPRDEGRARRGGAAEGERGTDEDEEDEAYSLAVLRLRFAGLLKFVPYLQAPDLNTLYSEFRLAAPLVVLSAPRGRPDTLLSYSCKKLGRGKGKGSADVFCFGKKAMKTVYFLNEVLVYPRMVSNLHDLVPFLSTEKSLASATGVEGQQYQPEKDRSESSKERDKREKKEKAYVEAKWSLSRQITQILRKLHAAGLRHRSPGAFSFEVDADGFVFLTDLALLTFDARPPASAPRNAEGQPSTSASSSSFSLSSSSSSASYPRPGYLDPTAASPEILKMYLDEQFRVPLSLSSAVGAWELGSVLFFIWCHAPLVPIDLSRSSKLIRMSAELAKEALKVVKSKKRSLNFNPKRCPAGGRDGEKIPSQMKTLLRRLLDPKLETRLTLDQIPQEAPEHFPQILQPRDPSAPLMTRM